MEDVRFVEQTERKSEIVAEIMGNLKEWFGIEHVNKRLAEEAVGRPMWVAWRGNVPVGFVTLKIHNQWTAELDVLAVRREDHRKGIGTRLVALSEKYLREKGFRFLTLKTLSESSPDEGYAHTRAFYKSLEFVPFEELPTLWNEGNPCLIMIKYLGNA